MYENDIILSFEEIINVFIFEREKAGAKITLDTFDKLEDLFSTAIEEFIESQYPELMEDENIDE